jgi:hypothetical protein
MSTPSRLALKTHPYDYMSVKVYTVTHIPVKIIIDEYTFDINAGLRHPTKCHKDNGKIFV